MRHLLWRLLAVLFIAVTALPAEAKPKVTVTTEYYTVTGSTIEELRQQMTDKGPKGFWGYAEWRVNWSSTCNVNLRITYTYPRWANREKASPKLRARWDRFIANLITHEKGHGTHGRNAAAEIDKTACAKDPVGIAKRWSNQDVIYDRKTNHGETQGAVF
jgi:predicted secreted Zn-dependent protease